MSDMERGDDFRFCYKCGYAGWPPSHKEGEHHGCPYLAAYAPPLPPSPLRGDAVSTDEVEKLTERIGTDATGGFHFDDAAVRPYAALLVRVREVLRGLEDNYAEAHALYDLGETEWTVAARALLSDLDKLVRPVRKEDR